MVWTKKSRKKPTRPVHPNVLKKLARNGELSVHSLDTSSSSDEEKNKKDAISLNSESEYEYEPSFKIVVEPRKSGLLAFRKPAPPPKKEEGKQPLHPHKEVLDLQNSPPVLTPMRTLPHAVSTPFHPIRESLLHWDTSSIIQVDEQQANVQAVKSPRHINKIDVISNITIRKQDSNRSKTKEQKPVQNNLDVCEVYSSSENDLPTDAKPKTKSKRLSKSARVKGGKIVKRPKKHKTINDDENIREMARNQMQKSSMDVIQERLNFLEQKYHLLATTKKNRRKSVHVRKSRLPTTPNEFEVQDYSGGTKPASVKKHANSWDTEVHTLLAGNKSATVAAKENIETIENAANDPEDPSITQIEKIWAAESKQSPRVVEKTPLTPQNPNLSANSKMAAGSMLAPSLVSKSTARRSKRKEIDENTEPKNSRVSLKPPQRLVFEKTPLTNLRSRVSKNVEYASARNSLISKVLPPPAGFVDNSPALAQEKKVTPPAVEIENVDETSMDSVEKTLKATDKFLLGRLLKRASKAKNKDVSVETERIETKTCDVDALTQRLQQEISATEEQVEQDAPQPQNGVDEILNDWVGDVEPPLAANTRQSYINAFTSPKAKNKSKLSNSNNASSSPPSSLNRKSGKRESVGIMQELLVKAEKGTITKDERTVLQFLKKKIRKDSNLTKDAVQSQAFVKAKSPSPPKPIPVPRKRSWKKSDFALVKEPVVDVQAVHPRLTASPTFPEVHVDAEVIVNTKKPKPAPRKVLPTLTVSPKDRKSRKSSLKAKKSPRVSNITPVQRKEQDLDRIDVIPEPETEAPPTFDDVEDIVEFKKPDPIDVKPIKKNKKKVEKKVKVKVGSPRRLSKSHTHDSSYNRLVTKKALGDYLQLYGNQKKSIQVVGTSRYGRTLKTQAHACSVILNANAYGKLRITTKKEEAKRKLRKEEKETRKKKSPKKMKQMSAVEELAEAETPVFDLEVPMEVSDSKAKKRGRKKKVVEEVKEPQLTLEAPSEPHLPLEAPSEPEEPRKLVAQTELKPKKRGRQKKAKEERKMEVAEAQIAVEPPSEPQFNLETAEEPCLTMEAPSEHPFTFEEPQILVPPMELKPKKRGRQKKAKEERKIEVVAVTPIAQEPYLPMQAPLEHPFTFEEPIQPQILVPPSELKPKKRGRKNKLNIAAPEAQMTLDSPSESQIILETPQKPHLTMEALLEDPFRFEGSTEPQKFVPSTELKPKTRGRRKKVKEGRNVEVPEAQMTLEPPSEPQLRLEAPQEPLTTEARLEHQFAFEPPPQPQILVPPTEIIPKKKRGRPRKNPPKRVSEVVPVVPAEEIAPPKAKFSWSEITADTADFFVIAENENYRHMVGPMLADQHISLLHVNPGRSVTNYMNSHVTMFLLVLSGDGILIHDDIVKKLVPLSSTVVLAPGFKFELKNMNETCPLHVFLFERVHSLLITDEMKHLIDTVVKHIGESKIDTCAV